MARIMAGNLSRRPKTGTGARPSPSAKKRKVMMREWTRMNIISQSLSLTAESKMRRCVEEKFCWI